MLQGSNAKRRRERADRATEVLASIQGYRTDRLTSGKLRKFAEMITGEAKEFDRSRFSKMIAESNARVEAARKAKGDVVSG